MLLIHQINIKYFNAYIIASALASVRNFDGYFNSSIASKITFLSSSPYSALYLYFYPTTCVEILLQLNILINFFVNINSCLNINLINQPTIQSTVLNKFVDPIDTINFLQCNYNTKTDSYSIFRV